MRDHDEVFLEKHMNKTGVTLFCTSLLIPDLVALTDILIVVVL